MACSPQHVRFYLRVDPPASISYSRAEPSQEYNMSAYSTQNDAKAKRNDRREEFKERVDANLEAEAERDPNP